MDTYFLTAMGCYGFFLGLLTGKKHTSWGMFFALSLGSFVAGFIFPISMPCYLFYKYYQWRAVGLDSATKADNR